MSADALRRLREHRSLLDRIAEAPLERETLDSADLALLMAGWRGFFSCLCAVYTLA